MNLKIPKPALPKLCKMSDTITFQKRHQNAPLFTQLIFHRHALASSAKNSGTKRGIRQDEGERIDERESRD
ncbi:hypothetical protein [Estrella lausannensis]|uniref:hypothetical protein n=1 Tax=Estrella lausannensis TaxID=483423 RepID=UPI000BF0D01D|nr:hypothetical protein [Estrella lausannensis]